MKRETIDLHIHTTFSDGSFTPSEIVEMAKGIGLRAIAITDHDEIAGNEEGYHAARSAGIGFIPGVEISVSTGDGKSHLLGYFIDWKDERLKKTLSLCRSYREERNPKIVEKLREMGVDITYEEVREIAKGQVVGKPHFAELLIKKGYASSHSDVFDRYLFPGSPADVQKKRISAREGIASIKGAGGIPVLAHPGDGEHDFDKVKRKILEFVELGIEGVEVYYSRHTREMREFLLDLTLSLGLIPTGGSDFHGQGRKQWVELGRGLKESEFGELEVPYEIYKNMVKAHKERGRFTGQLISSILR